MYKVVQNFWLLAEVKNLVPRHHHYHNQNQNYHEQSFNDHITMREGQGFGCKFWEGVPPTHHPVLLPQFTAVFLIAKFSPPPAAQHHLLPA